MFLIAYVEILASQEFYMDCFLGHMTVFSIVNSCLAFSFAYNANFVPSLQCFNRSSKCLSTFFPKFQTYHRVIY